MLEAAAVNSPSLEIKTGEVHLNVNIRCLRDFVLSHLCKKISYSLFLFETMKVFNGFR